VSSTDVPLIKLIAREHRHRCSSGKTLRGGCGVRPNEGRKISEESCQAAKVKIISEMVSKFTVSLGNTQLRVGINYHRLSMHHQHVF
jgi:hypothetical protein